MEKFVVAVVRREGWDSLTSSDSTIIIMQTSLHAQRRSASYLPSKSTPEPERHGDKQQHL